MVAALDEAVGNITDALHNRGFMQNALVIFTTDVSFCKTFSIIYNVLRNRLFEYF